MNILVAIDSFKGTIDSIEGSSIIANAIKDSGFQGEVIVAPMADGGEGSISIVKSIIGGNYVDIEVMGPCLQNIKTHYLLNKDKAYIEVALVSGFNQIDDLSILDRTSEGLGMAIIDAINKGAKEINIFLGGSATSDLGLGMLDRLGVKFNDGKGEAFFPLPEIFNEIKSIDKSALDNLKDYKFIIICDVTNPLVGPNGTSYTYAKQKGASKEEIEILEEGANHVADIIFKDFGDDIKKRKYYGASGGMGMAFSYFLNAKIYEGSEYFASLYKLDELIKDVDLLITGEGKLDNTSFKGKVVSYIVNLAKKHHKRVLAIVGKSSLSKDECLSNDINDVIILNQDEQDIEIIKQTAKKDLYNKVLNYFKQKLPE